MTNEKFTIKRELEKFIEEAKHERVCCYRVWLDSGKTKEVERAQVAILNEVIDKLEAILDKEHYLKMAAETLKKIKAAEKQKGAN